MLLRTLTTGTILLLALLLSGCGDSDSDIDKPLDLATLLPENVKAAGIERSSKVRTFVGPDLYEHIDGGAELYHTYGFVDVVTAYYMKGETEVVADIFRFDTSDHAYGLYSVLRPDEPVPISLGVEGHTSPSSIEFVKGQVVVRLTGYDESEESAGILLALANAIAELTPGTTSHPETFTLFPAENRLPYSDQIVSENFLGVQSLTDVYCQTYLVHEDTVTLFLTVDQDGAKLTNWAQADGALDNPEQASSLGYDADHALLMPEYYYGPVIAGSKGDMLLGAVNYSEVQAELLAGWINRIK